MLIMIGAELTPKISLPFPFSWALCGLEEQHWCNLEALIALAWNMWICGCCKYFHSGIFMAWAILASIPGPRGPKQTPKAQLSSRGIRVPDNVEGCEKQQSPDSGCSPSLFSGPWSGPPDSKVGCLSSLGHVTCIQCKNRSGWKICPSGWKNQQKWKPVFGIFT